MELPMDQKALFKIGYGLYVLTALEDGRHNGCIINTAQQLTDTPSRLSITVSKRNLTHDMVMRTGQFNLSVLSQEADFAVFRHFGFQSGREAEKIAGYPGIAYSANGLSYLQTMTNAYLSAQVFHTVDLGTHTLFLANLTGAEILSDAESATYAYYHARIKPKPEKKAAGWRCRICGYVYEGEELPPDYICPLCKHGAVDFEKIEPLKGESDMKKYVCDVCGYVYDEAAGDPDNGIAPGTKWEDLPEDFVCPLCGVGKDQFSAE